MGQIIYKYLKLRDLKAYYIPTYIHICLYMYIHMNMYLYMNDIS